MPKTAHRSGFRNKSTDGSLSHQHH